MAQRPLSQVQQLELARIAQQHTCPNLSTELCVSVPDGQPYRLRLLHAIAECTQDPDSSLPTLLMEGVPTGIFDELPTSSQWQQRPRGLADDSLGSIQLSQRAGNWSRAERDPILLRTLLQKEIEAGHVKAFSGSRQDAETKWPQRAAIGKLNIVRKAARKTVKIKEDEQGTVLFEVDDRMYHYAWGGLIHRIFHRIAGHLQHRSWLYVDDLLALFLQANLSDGVCVTALQYRRPQKLAEGAAGR